MTPVKRMVAQRSEVETGVGTVRPGTRRLLEKLNSIIIPQLDFRAANIHDVITYIDLQAQAADKDSPPNERGVNIVLNLQRPGSAVTTAAPAQEVDPFAMTAEPAGRCRHVPFHISCAMYICWMPSSSLRK